MRKILKRFTTAILAAAMVLVLFAGCSNEPCNYCGETPTKGYKNKSADRTEYYCSECSSECGWCGEKATKHYESALGVIVFVCKDCYKEIMELNS